MSDPRLEHEHTWMAVTTFTQQEYQRWICVLCGQKRVRVVRDAPVVEVDRWPSK
jgi:hypothetical protein